MTYKALYEYGKKKLEEAGIEEASLDARLLLEYVCHTNRNELLVYGDKNRSEFEAQVYQMAIDRRAARIPLQHITGEQEFMGLRFRVNEHVLIPRQDTEILVEEAMRCLADGMRILDLCTGSGCILLSLLKYSNECEGIGIDISDKALLTARENASALQLDAVFLEGDLFAPLENYVSSKTKDRLFDIVVSNPPYIKSDEMKSLQSEVQYEPSMALDGGIDGLDFYRIINDKWAHKLLPDGVLFLEIGNDQGESILTVLDSFKNIEVLKDMYGNDRMVTAERKDY